MGTNHIINRHNLNLDNEKGNHSGAYEFKINYLQINNQQKTFTVCLLWLKFGSVAKMSITKKF